MAIDDRRNKGFILKGAPPGRGRAFIVTGLHRSGTSLVASILQRAGLLMGSEINDVAYQDEELFGVVERQPARPESVIRVRVAHHGVELDNSGSTLRELRRG